MVLVVFSAFRGVCDISLIRVPAPPTCDFVMAAMQCKKTSRRCYHGSCRRDEPDRQAILCSCGMTAPDPCAMPSKNAWSACCRGRNGSSAQWRRLFLPGYAADLPGCDQPPLRRRLFCGVRTGQAQALPLAAAAPMVPVPEGQAVMKSASTAAVPRAQRLRSATSKAPTTAGSRPVAP